MKISKDRFLELSKEVHGDKYDYSLVEYKNTSTKVKIICPEHGFFEKRPKHHYSGSGCKECSSNRQKLSLSEFIERSNELHNNRYDYSEFEYINSRTKSIIICPEHGEFEQSPNHHLSGRGCKECWKEDKFIGTEEFIIRSNQVHNNSYDYSLTEYKGSLEKVIIICPEHGEFKQESSSHLMGAGCPVCNSSKGERRIYKYLDNKIKFESQFRLGNNLILDFYIPSLNTGIEYDGIQHFESVEIFGGEENLILTKDRDLRKNKYCQENKIDLIRISYLDFNNIESILKNKLKL